MSLRKYLQLSTHKASSNYKLRICSTERDELSNGNEQTGEKSSKIHQTINTKLTTNKIFSIFSSQTRFTFDMSQWFRWSTVKEETLVKPESRVEFA